MSELWRYLWGDRRAPAVGLKGPKKRHIPAGMATTQATPSLGTIGTVATQLGCGSAGSTEYSTYSGRMEFW